MRTTPFTSFKTIPGILLLCIFLLAGTCKKKTDAKTMTQNLALVEKTWLHSHEESRGDTLVFRPNTYDFPPSRGRIGFKMDADGTFHQFDIAPTDGLEEHPGHWEMRGEKIMTVTFPDKKSTDFTAEIISMTPEMLKVKKTFKQ
jgi:hypothetical protein